MRLRTKAFWLTLLLFAVAFYAGVYGFSRLSYASMLEGARAQALREYALVSDALADDIAALEARGQEDEALRDLGAYYAARYRARGVQLALRRGDAWIAGAVHDAQGLSRLAPGAGQRASTVLAYGDARLLYVVGDVASGIALVYARDITDQVAAQRDLASALTGIAAAIALAFALALRVIVGALMRPIERLTSSAERIADGDVSVRADVRGGVEAVALATRFNAMADELLRRVEDERAQSERMQRFVDSFAHELRTPLTAIAGYAQYLGGANATEADRAVACGYIVEQTRRMRDIGEKLMAMACGREGIERRTVAMEALVARLIEAHGGEAIDADIALTSLEGEPDLLFSLLDNLVVNAMRAGRPGDRVVVRMRDGPPTWEIVDRGVGMTPEQLSRAMEPFYRADPARSRGNGGAGLGLALCNEIAIAHGARLELESQAGRGTVARVRFGEGDDGARSVLQVPDKSDTGRG